MNRSSIVVILVVIVALRGLTGSGQSPDSPKGFLWILKSGQKVDMKEVAGRYEIRTDGGTTVGCHKVVEVGSDYVTVEDEAGLAETRIPLYSIKSFVRLKTP